MAAVNKITLEQVPGIPMLIYLFINPKGTGKHGHITKEDMLSFLSGKTQVNLCKLFSTNYVARGSQESGNSCNSSASSTFSYSFLVVCVDLKSCSFRCSCYGNTTRPSGSIIRISKDNGKDNDSCQCNSSFWIFRRNYS